MEVVLIKAKYKELFSISETLKNKLKAIPNKVGLVSTVQFSDFLKNLKEELEKLGKEVFVYKEGQILGCNPGSALEIEDKVESFIYVGSGKFHVYGMALKLKKEIQIFILDPASKSFSRFDWLEIRRLKQRQKTQEIRFLSADKIGILCSTKPGQQNLARAIRLKTDLENKGKKSYLFLFDNLDKSQFENFSEIKSWVNTACPGIFYDADVSWIGDVSR